MTRNIGRSVLSALHIHWEFIELIQNSPRSRPIFMKMWSSLMLAMFFTIEQPMNHTLFHRTNEPQVVT